MATHSSIDLDSPPMTPSASDLSDLGSLSDSEWFEITSSSHGSQSDSDDEDNIPRPAALQTPDGLHLSLAGDADWQGLSDEHVAHPSIPEGVQSLEESPDITNSLDPAPSLVQASWETLQGAPGSSDVNVAYHSPSPEGFKLEFPDPLSSSSDDMHGSSMASTGTWTQSELRDPEDVAESPAADAPQPADLLIIVLGHRPSLLRTQRVVNMLVEAVGDALGAHHLTHHNHAISCEPFLSHAAPLFGTHDIAYGKQHTYRIVASDGVDADKAHLGPAHRSLALVFFSPTRITRSLPTLDVLPPGTKFLPLIPSNSSTSSPPSRRARERISSGADESFSFPSSVESSILINSPEMSGLSASLHAQRVHYEWLSLHIPSDDVLDLWPRADGVTRDGLIVMPTALLERRAAMVGMREGLFSEPAPVPVLEPEMKLAAKQEGSKDERPRVLALVREYHAWTAIALLSMLLAVFSSQFVAMRNSSSAVGWSNATAAPASSTNTVAPPLPSATTGLPTHPASPAPVQDNSLLPSSIRNLALSVFGSDDAAKDVAEVPSEAGPCGARPVERETSAISAATPKKKKGTEKQQGATSGSRGAQTKSPAAAAVRSAEPESTPAPLTLDAPATKARFIPLLGSRASTGPPKPASTTDLMARLSSSLALYYPRELRELMAATDELLAAVRRCLVIAHADPRVAAVSDFVVRRHNRARRNARRIAERIAPKRAREGLRRVADFVATRREKRWTDRVRRGVEGMGRVDWENLRRNRKPVEKKGKCTKLFCGVLGRRERDA